MKWLTLIFVMIPLTVHAQTSGNPFAPPQPPLPPSRVQPAPYLPMQSLPPTILIPRAGAQAPGFAPPIVGPNPGDVWVDHGNGIVTGPRPGDTWIDLGGGYVSGPDSLLMVPLD